MEEIKEWSQDADEHYKVCERKDCGYIYDESREDHKGGSETCTAGKICSICQKEYTDAAGHKWNTLKWDHDEKFHFRRCSVCDVIDDESKTAHEYTQEVISSKYYAREATCTTPTQYYKSCECGHYSDQTFNVGEALGHTRGDKWINTDPTNHYYLCEVCSSRLDEKTHVLDQLIVSDDNVASEATCTQSAKYYLSCACGYNPKSKDHVDESGEPLGHWWDLDTYRVDTANTKHYFGCNREGCTAVYEGSEGLHTGGEATCISAGYCLVCGHDYLRALGHTADTSKWIVDYENNVHYHSCVRCTEHMDVTAHNYDQKVTTADYLCTEATCEKKATYYYSCVCGLADKSEGCKTFEYGEPNGHSFGWTYDDEEHVKKCTVCEKPDESTRGSHDEKSATCVNDAVCTCDYVIEQALGHDISDWTSKDGEVHDKHCLRENCEYVEAEGTHEWGEFSRTQDPTCLEEGVDSRYCIICHDGVNTRSVAKLPHVYNEDTPIIVTIVDEAKSTDAETWFIHIVGAPCIVTEGCTAYQEMGRTDSVLYNTFNSEIQYPTCTEDGYVRILPPADIVNATVYEEVLPALGHEYNEDGYCIRCGISQTKYSQGLEFVSNGDGTCYVAGIGTCTDTDILIPPVSPDGDAVTAIGNDAFCGNTAITSVVIPEGVLTIGEYAFASSSLQNIVISASVTEIGVSAFEYCGSLGNCTIPENSQLTVLGETAFAWCGNLTSIYIPAGVTAIEAATFRVCQSLERVTFASDSSLVSIDAAAFVYCESLTDLVLPESLTHIGAQAFGQCALESIRIPAGVVSIDDVAFQECWDLRSVEFPENSQLTHIGDSAFSTSGIRSISIPASVESIGDYAFSYCYSLESLTFPEDSKLTSIGEGAFDESYMLNCSITLPIGLKVIADYAFRHCGSLVIVIPENSELTTIGNGAFKDLWIMTEINIPAGVTAINEEAFSGMEALTDVYYNGTEEDWNKITIGTNNDPLLNATIHFKEPEIQYSQGLAFTSNGDGTCYVAGIGTCTDTDIVIPPTSPDGDTVTAIGADAFSSKTIITSVTIPESVTSIGNNAFYNCRGLTSITIPESVTNIGGGAFSNCTGLEEIRFNATAMTDLKSKNSVFYQAGTNGAGIRVVIGKNVTKIP
ncbi:MAG: leucine-rich repeat domain-containing protein, partial [Clostridia bacterium]|nr:leucine-rich repeat domain-containing protein [Clostridia bacterium]